MRDPTIIRESQPPSPFIGQKSGHPSAAHGIAAFDSFWLPFGLLDGIGLMTPVIVCFIAYTFLALEALGAELDNPFGRDPNDLPPQALSHQMEASLLEMIDEPPRTTKPEVVHSILT